MGTTRALTALLAGGSAALSCLAASASHCTADEVTLFSCSIGRKTVSLCASSRPPGDAAAWPQYRYGPLGRPELVLPAREAGWRDAVRGGVLTYSGGGGAYLAFTNGTYRYVAYTAIGRDWGPKAGVVVERDGRRLASLQCTTEAQSRLGPDLFASLGVAVDDPPRFELP